MSEELDEWKSSYTGLMDKLPTKEKVEARIKKLEEELLAVRRLLRAVTVLENSPARGRPRKKKISARRKEILDSIQIDETPYVPVDPLEEAKPECTEAPTNLVSQSP